MGIRNIVFFLNLQCITRLEACETISSKEGYEINHTSDHDDVIHGQVYHLSQNAYRLSSMRQSTSSIRKLLSIGFDCPINTYTCMFMRVFFHPMLNAFIAFLEI